ncbi:MAG: hypothetical protein GY853_09560 [PVC group bacterium]|nr:hypothetical protein [PVC group bacterium]
MNTELRKSIFSVGNKIVGLNEKFFYLKAKQNLFPHSDYVKGAIYCVFYYLPSTFTFDSCNAFEFPIIQVSGYGANMEKLEQVANQFIQQFHRRKENFIMDNYWCIDVECELAFDTLTDTGFQFVQQYKFHTQEKYPHHLVTNTGKVDIILKQSGKTIRVNE